jgi:hypothetical protein
MMLPVAKVQQLLDRKAGGSFLPQKWAVFNDALNS